MNGHGNTVGHAYATLYCPITSQLWRYVLWLNGASWAKLTCYWQLIGSRIDWYQNEWPWPTSPILCRRVTVSDPARTRLRSASSSDYTVPRTRTKLGDRAFSVVGPVVWNSLPAAVREADSLHRLGATRKLKTHLFTLCFNDWLSVFYKLL